MVGNPPFYTYIQHSALLLIVRNAVICLPVSSSHPPPWSKNHQKPKKKLQSLHPLALRHRPGGMYRWLLDAAIATICTICIWPAQPKTAWSSKRQPLRPQKKPLQFPKKSVVYPGENVLRSFYLYFLLIYCTFGLFEQNAHFRIYLHIFRISPKLGGS